MSENSESIENIRQIMEDIELVDGVNFVDIIMVGPDSQECKVLLGDFEEGLRTLRSDGVICSEIETALLDEARETIEFFHEKYCS